MKYNLKGNKIYFDDFFYIDLNRDTIVEYDLKNRDEITEQEYEELITKRAYSMAYFLLAKKDYSSKELYQKLIIKYREKQIVSKLIEDFIEKGYLDDYEYGKNYIAYHNYGKKKMEYMLFQKGISADIIRSLLEENKERELKEIEKQWLKLGNKDKEKKILSLMRKGFEYRDIQKVISNL